MINCTFINNQAQGNGGGVNWVGDNGTITNSTFINNVATNGGGIHWYAYNGKLTDSTFTSNTATNGGAVYWHGNNSTMNNCNFTSNYATHGDNVYWIWTATEFLNKYSQINNNDYVLIRGNGTPTNTIILNKKSITLSSDNKASFDAKGGNLHFEVTGDNILIENLTFRNFNFTGYGGAIQWNGNNGILQNCNFINNTGTHGGAVLFGGNNCTLKSSNFSGNTAKIYGGAVNFWGNNCYLIDCTFYGNTAINGGGAVNWSGINGTLTNSIFNNNVVIDDGGAAYWYTSAINCTLTGSTFINNTSNRNGGAIVWRAANGTLTDSTFINNTAKNYGGAIFGDGYNGKVTGSTFTGNTATIHGGGIFLSGGAFKTDIIGCNFTDNIAITGSGGGICWDAYNGTVIISTFTHNTANSDGGGIRMNGVNATIISSTFINNNADRGGAIQVTSTGLLLNCSFINSKSQQNNGIYANKNLNFNYGNGIVYVFINGTLSGISIVVLNNATYYYPPNSNINFIEEFFEN